jgi:urea transport system permease protein
MLLAMSEREDRVRFSGYDVSMYKVFSFCLAAALSGIGGALFVLQVGFISPSLVGIVPSIEMVIFAAVGGRGSLFGAIYGTLLVSAGKSLFSESFPQLWLFCMGGLFIAVVVLFPNGLAGLVDQISQRLAPWWKRRRESAPVAAIEPSIETPAEKGAHS